MSSLLSSEPKKKQKDCQGILNNKLRLTIRLILLKYKLKQLKQLVRCIQQRGGVHINITRAEGTHIKNHALWVANQDASNCDALLFVSSKVAIPCHQLECRIHRKRSRNEIVSVRQSASFLDLLCVRQDCRI
jgi:hypothetical protein